MPDFRFKGCRENFFEGKAMVKASSDKPKGIAARVRYRLWSIVQLALMLPLLISGLLYFMQDRLIFPGAMLSEGQRIAIRERFGEREISLEVEDGVTLHGWFLPAAGEGPSPLLIYFGGNAEEVSQLLAYRDRLAGWSLLLFNYRGFGLSGGEPSEQALVNDALAIHDHGRALPRVAGSPIVAWGRSLGTGVAVQLAAARPLAGLILTTPYDSITALAQRRYPFVPVSWLLRHPFDSAKLAPTIQVPMLSLIAGLDQVVPPQHGLALSDAWTGAHQTLVIKEEGHNSIHRNQEYWQAIQGFLDALAE
jgi:pimeloyl-ACP methyl ester carboxylesterase